MIIGVDRYGPFPLHREFLAPDCVRPINWGFGALSWVTDKRAYSRDG